MAAAPRPRLDFLRIQAHAQLLGAQLVHRGIANGHDMVARVLAAKQRESASRKQLDSVLQQRKLNQPVDKALLHQLRQAALDASTSLDALALALPNWTHPDVPVGPETSARVVKIGASKPPMLSAPAEPKDHLALLHDVVDFESAARATGPRFVYLKGKAALCELGLVNLALQRLVAKGFAPVSTPDLVKPWLLEACGFQPRGHATQTYHIKDHDLCLTGTAEVPLAGLFAGRAVDSTHRLAGYGHCFRTEAGAAGAKQRGLYRVHQFTKVEMFVVAPPGQSEAEFDLLVNAQVEMCEALGVQYRVLDMPTEELGASAFRKFDVEVWMPGSKRWGEVVTNCQDFQARRLDCRFNKDFAHTLNGTALAVPRVLMALAETHQTSDGRVVLPKALADVVGFDHLVA
jgi:seryl-tRNA synthetase